jgi:hypothetical protein
MESAEILDGKNWLFFKFYRNPTSVCTWQDNLNWYHQTLMTIVKKIVDNNENVVAVFFGIYGQDHYDDEDEEFEKRITFPPGSNFVFIRLRLAVKLNNKEALKKTLLTLIENNKELVWDYELMNTYRVMSDDELSLGRRFGSNEEDQTLKFVRYWDAGCRYILSILTMPGNWKADVDVWGIPHLINNSIGARLRPKTPRKCEKCGAPMYMNTTLSEMRFNLNAVKVPAMEFSCNNCSTPAVISTRI